MPVNTRLQVRRGTYPQWTGINPVLYDGEIGYEKDTGKFKIGDGSTNYLTLNYSSVPLNSGNYRSYSGVEGSGVNIDFDPLQEKATWSVDTDWLENFIANSSGSLNTEGVQDIVGSGAGTGGFLVNGTGLEWSYDDPNNQLTISVTGIPHDLITDWDAALSGNIDTQLIAGTGINFVYDSGNNTLTISTAVLDDTHTHIWDNITDAKVKASLTELGYLSGVVPGTASAERVLVLDSDKDITGIDNLTSNATITAVTFSGDLSGDVTSTGTSSFSDIDVNGGSIDGTIIGANAAAVVSGTSVFASAGFFGNLTGDVTGNADTSTESTNVTVTANDNNNETVYLTFVAGTGTQGVERDVSLKYNPSTNLINVGDLTASGTLTGEHVQTNTLTTTGDVTVGGDLTVAGTTTTVNSTVVEIGDNVIKVNTSGLSTGGLEVQDGSTGNYKEFIWNNSNGRWEVGDENFQANRFVSTIPSASGAPFVVASTGRVTNLNADLLDDQTGSYYLDWSHFTNTPTPDVSVALTGDVSGSATVSSWNLSDNLTINVGTTIQPNSVALSGDTTGDYVENLSVSGTGLGIDITSGEAQNPTISSNATPVNTSGAIVSRDSSGNFSAGTITASLAGNASTASKLATARYIELTGDVVGSGLFDGSADIQISTTVEGAGTVTLANEASDTDNYLTFANDATGDQSLKTNVNIRYNASGNVLLGTSSGSTTPTTRLEYFLIDGGTP